MMIDVFIPCIPPRSTAQGSNTIVNRPGGQPFVAKTMSSKAKQVEGEFFAMFHPYKPDVPYDVPVAVDVRYVYPWRASEKKAIRQKLCVPCATLPDCDNIAKLFLDVLTRCGYWTNDSRVADLRVRKFFGASPGIGLIVYELAF